MDRQKNYPHATWLKGFQCATNGLSLIGGPIVETLEVRWDAVYEWEGGRGEREGER